MLDRQGASRIQAEVLDLMQPRWWARGAESRMRACAGGFGSPRRLGRGGGSPCEGVFPVLSAWVLWRKGEDIATFPCSLWHWGMWFSDGGVEGQVDGWTILKVVSNLNNSIILASWVTLGSWNGEGDTNFIISVNTYVPGPCRQIPVHVGCSSGHTELPASGSNWAGVLWPFILGWGTKITAGRVIGL